jgi:hypothetical protein
VACTVICIGAVTVFWMTAGRPSGWWPALHQVGVLGVLLLGADAALHPEKPTWELFLAAGWGVVFTVVRGNGTVWTVELPKFKCLRPDQCSESLVRRTEKPEDT